MHTDQCYGGSCYQGGISHNSDGGGCGCQSCGCECDSEMDFMDELMDLTERAKMLLLKEKIKTRLETKMGKKLDKMADIAVEAFINTWDMEKERETKEEMINKRLEDLMSGGKDQ